MARITKAEAARRGAATEDLRKIIEQSNSDGGRPIPGEVRTVLRHVSQSGMLRVIDAFVVINDEVIKVGSTYATASGDAWDHSRSGVKMSGVGMDMGFALVYNMGRLLYPKGFACIGQGCPSNDHSNGDRDYTPGHVIHADGGYRLRQRWL